MQRRNLAYTFQKDRVFSAWNVRSVAVMRYPFRMLLRPKRKENDSSKRVRFLLFLEFITAKAAYLLPLFGLLCGVLVAFRASKESANFFSACLLAFFSPSASHLPFFLQLFTRMILSDLGVLGGFFFLGTGLYAGWIPSVIVWLRAFCTGLLFSFCWALLKAEGSLLVLFALLLPEALVLLFFSKTAFCIKKLSLLLRRRILLDVEKPIIELKLHRRRCLFLLGLVLVSNCIKAALTCWILPGGLTVG